MMFVTLVAVELKANEMLLFFAAHPHSQHRGQRAWEGEGRRAEQLEEVPDQRVGEAGDKRAAEVGKKIQLDKWPQCLSRASCLHLQAATQAVLC